MSASQRREIVQFGALFLLFRRLGIVLALPALAQDVDVRLGRGHDRERVRGESRTVVIRRDRDGGWYRGWDHDRGVHRKVIIER
jgi:hypothetical protein